MKKLSLSLLLTFLVLPVSGECRRFNGKFNNHENPLWGSAGSWFLRLTPADYGDPNIVDGNQTPDTNEPNDVNEPNDINEPNTVEPNEIETTDSNITNASFELGGGFTNAETTNTEISFTNAETTNTEFTGGFTNSENGDTNFPGQQTPADANFFGISSDILEQLFNGDINSIDTNNPIDFNTIDANAIPARIDQPSARQISNIILDQNESIPDPCGRTDFVWAWADFIDHDLVSVEPAEPPEFFNIYVPVNDPNFTSGTFLQYLRSRYDPNSTPRQQLNLTTAWLDASMVYGPNIIDNNSLRTFTGGRLKVTSSANGDLLPHNDVNVVGDVNLFMSGDDQTNESIVSIALHTLFVREHNRLCALIEANEPNWSDDKIFQKVRHIVGGEIQAITYNEFLPAFLNGIEPNTYCGYDPNINPAISQEFAFGAYKIHLSGVSPQLVIRDANADANTADVNLPYTEALFNPQYVVDNGIDSILNGLAAQRQQQIDTFIISALRNNFNGSDLAAQLIQRGRDHGIASYNAIRTSLSFQPVTSFNQLSSDPNIRAALQIMYDNDVNNIDPWIGFLAEYNATSANAITDANDANTTAIIKLSRRIIRQQFERLRNADRFWYTIDPNLTSAEIADLNNLKLRDVIQRNTAVTGLRKNVFFIEGVNEPNEPNESNEPNEPDEITDIINISNIRVMDNFVLFFDTPLVIITGTSLDFREANIMEGNTVDIVVFADSSDEPSVDEAIPLNRFFSRCINISFIGPAPVLSLRIGPRTKSFQIILEEADLLSADRLTLNIGIGNYLGQGSGIVQNQHGFLQAFWTAMNGSPNRWVPKCE